MLGQATTDFERYLPLFLGGMATTLELFMAALPASFFLALPIAAARNAKGRSLRILAHGYILFFRGAPLLPVLFLFYYGLPQVPGIRTSALWPILREPFPIALLALVLNSAAFQAEILAGALRVVPRGELDAARVAGFHGLTLLRHIVAPHVVRIAARAYGNEIVFVLKATAIASFITLQDMMGAANAVYLRSFDPLTPLLVAGIFYLVIVGIVMAFRSWLERVVAPPEANLKSR
jgi:His/Glu/Gln/Arg/opine family amino acid ABC transporter permease subunit